MNIDQVKNIHLGLMAFVATVGAGTLTGFSFSQAFATYRLILNIGGFFVAPYNLIFQYVAHSSIAGILAYLALKVGQLAYQSFKAAYNDIPFASLALQFPKRVKIS